MRELESQVPLEVENLVDARKSTMARSKLDKFKIGYELDKTWYKAKKDKKTWTYTPLLQRLWQLITSRQR